MATVVPGPDEIAFRADLRDGRFAVGELSGQWAITEITWPHVVAWIAVPKRENGPERFYVRIDCGGYPNRGPTGTFWDTATKAALGHGSWPKGRARVKHVFRTDWENGRAFYHPFDGFAFEKHSDWTRKYPRKLWSRDRTIGDWLAEFHELLNSDEYTGT
jgi:hypothetical protein